MRIGRRRSRQRAGPRRAAGDARPLPQPPGPLDYHQAQASLAAALDRRSGLPQRLRTNALRWFHGAGDGVPGFVLEQYDDVLVAQMHDGVLALDEHAARRLAESARSALGARAVYLKRFPADRSAALKRLESFHRDETPWIGDAVEPERTVSEHALNYIVRPYDGYSTGLFLDQRANRARIRAAADAKSLLNLFAYTCSFSVAAAAGGAARTTSVDASRRYLEWGKRNFAVNRLSLENHTFICSDALAYFKRAARQGRRFDILVVDPPAFGRDKASGRVFALVDDLDALLGGAVGLLASGGLLLFTTNLRGLRRARILGALRRAAGHRRVRRPDELELPADFAGDPDYARSFLMQLD